MINLKHLLYILLLMPIIVEASTHVNNNKPIRIGANDKEIFLSFEGPVKYMDTDLFQSIQVSEYLMITNTTNGLLVKAKQPFPELRVQLARVDKEQVYLIDFFNADESKDINIVDLNEKNETPSLKNQNNFLADCNFIGCIKDVRARLLRYGFQRHYAPSRLIDPLPGSFMSTKKDKVSLQSSFSSSTLETVLFGGYKLIVVQVVNKTNTLKTIDPRNIFHEKINMISAYSWKLEPKGKQGDSTLLFIIAEV